MTDRVQSMDRIGQGRDIAYDYRRTIGYRVRELRLKADMTQRQLGDLLGISETGVSALELGRSTVSPERYEKLADIFGENHGEWGKWLLRYTDPYLYALIFGNRDEKLQADLASLNEASRLNRTRGPRR
jgi:transcriptional regulator with XRE-family HTH domain